MIGFSDFTENDVPFIIHRMKKLVRTCSLTYSTRGRTYVAKELILNTMIIIVFQNMSKARNFRTARVFGRSFGRIKHLFINDQFRF